MQRSLIHRAALFYSNGYTALDMLPISTDFTLELMEWDVPVYMLNADSTEKLAFDSEDLTMHKRVEYEAT